MPVDPLRPRGAALECTGRSYVHLQPCRPESSEEGRDGREDEVACEGHGRSCRKNIAPSCTVRAVALVLVVQLSWILTPTVTRPLDKGNQDQPWCVMIQTTLSEIFCFLESKSSLLESFESFLESKPYSLTSLVSHHSSVVGTTVVRCSSDCVIRQTSLGEMINLAMFLQTQT